MLLFHFTSPLHIPAIRQTGHLTTTDPMLTMEPAPPDGPRVVWLTDDPEPAAQLWARPLAIPAMPKDEIRLTVDLDDQDPNLHRWVPWAITRGITAHWANALARSGGDPDRWWIAERTVPRAEWRETLNLRTGRELPMGPLQPALT